jgi:hypothetical protein
MTLIFKFNYRVLTQALLGVFSIASGLLLSASYALAGEADVVKVTAQSNTKGLWRFSVTVRHDDAGWDHYANNWEVLSPDGEVIATRILAHPHIHEQPFTRSLSGIQIPDDLTSVLVRARDSVHGYGGEMISFDLKSGETKTVQAHEDLKAKPSKRLGKSLK